MKSTALLLYLSIISTPLLGQVGINNNNPKTTLDILGKPTNISIFDGMIIPRITGDQLALKNYTTDQTASLIYVTSLPTTATGQVAKIDRAGIYYFDGSLWKRLMQGDESKENPILTAMYDTGTYNLPDNRNYTFFYPYSSTTYNVEGWMNSTTGRFTPKKAGYYLINASARIYRGAAVESEIQLLKNTTPIGRVSTFGNVVNNVMHLVYLNGTTDYVYVSTGSGTANAGETMKESTTYFSAIYVGEATQQVTKEVNIYSGGSNPVGILGDVKQGFQTADHQGWIKLDGRNISTLTLSQQKTAKLFGYTTNLPNATNAYLSPYGSGKLGSLQGSNDAYLQRNQLPPVQLDVTIDNGGNHRHSMTMPVADSGGFPMYENSVGAPFRLANGGVNTGATTDTEPDHTHTGSTNYLHSDSGTSTAQSPINTEPKSINVNTFMFLGS